MTNVEKIVKKVCFGRDDLLNVAEQMAYEVTFGDGEELCEVLAQAAYNYFVNNIYRYI